jgi:hypothetical protein
MSKYVTFILNKAQIITQGIKLIPITIIIVICILIYFLKNGSY